MHERTVRLGGGIHAHSAHQIRMPLHPVTEERSHLEFLPQRFAMRSTVDAIVILNRTRPITVFDGVYDLER